MAAEMPPRRKSSTGEPWWWERLEKMPVGTYGGIAIVAGEIVLFIVYWRGWWTIDVIFFAAVGWLTFILGVLAAYAAIAQFFHRDEEIQHRLFRLPEWLQDFEEYFRYLVPVMFAVGIIFGHYFWH